MALEKAQETLPGRTAITPALTSASYYHGQHVPYIAKVEHGFWVLDYSFGEHGLVRVGSAHSAWRVRAARTAHLYPPGTTYWEDTRKATGERRSAWVLFTGGEQAGLMDLIRPRLRHARFDDPEELLGSLISEAATVSLDKGETAFWESQSLLCRVLHLLFNAEYIENGTFRVRSADAGRVSDFIRKVNAVLGRDLAAPLSLADAAAEVHVSPSALSHRYKRETGTAPMAARQAMRIERAKALLLRGFPLKAIADELGFSDAFHLSKAFKQVLGSAPRHFLQQLRLPRLF